MCVYIYIGLKIYLCIGIWHLYSSCILITSRAGENRALLSPPHNFKSNIFRFASESNLTVSPRIIWLKKMKVRCIILTLSSPHHDSDDSLGITGNYCLSHYVCLIFYEPKMYEHMVSNKINNKSLGEKLHSENSVNITSIYKITFKEEKYI